MKLDRTYDEENYEEAIMVVGLNHKESLRDLDHEKTLDEAWSK
jgi:hypothetical protein